MAERNLTVKFDIVGLDLLQKLQAEINEIRNQGIKIPIKIDFGQVGGIQNQIEAQVREIVSQIPTAIKRQISQQAGYGSLIGETRQTINQTVTEILSGPSVNQALAKQNQANYEKQVQEEVQAVKQQREARLKFAQTLAPSSDINQEKNRQAEIDRYAQAKAPSSDINQAEQTQKAVSEYHLKTGQGIGLLADRARQLDAIQAYQSATADQSKTNQPELDAIRARKDQLAAQGLTAANVRQARQDFQQSKAVISTNEGVEKFNRNTRLAEADLKGGNLGLDYLKGGHEAVADVLSRRYGFSRAYALQLSKQSNVGDAFAGSRIFNKESATQIGFAGLFAGFPGIVGATVGATSQLGPQGAFFGSVLAQKGAQNIVGLFDKLTEGFKIAAEAGLEFQRALLGITAVFQQTSTLTRDGNPVSVGEALRINEARARTLQNEARYRLAPLGISGSQEVNLVQAIIAGNVQKGGAISDKNVINLAEGLGSAAQALAPDLLTNESRLRRDIRDIITGSPQASRTTFGAALGPQLTQQIGNAITPEDFERVTKSLQGFVEAIKNSDGAIVSLNKIFATFNNSITSLGDALLRGLSPALKDLSSVVTDPHFIDNLRNFSSAFGRGAGTVGGNIGRTAGAIGQNLGTLGSLIPIPGVPQALGALPLGFEFLRIRGAAREVDERERERLTQEQADRNPSASAIEAGARTAITREQELGPLRQKGVSTLLFGGQVKQYDVQLQSLNTQLEEFNKIVEASNGVVPEKTKLEKEALETEIQDIQIKRQIAELQDRLIQIDQFTFDGKRRSLAIQEQIDIASRVPESVAAARRERGEQDTDIERVNTIVAFDEKLRDTNDALFQFPLKLSIFQDKVVEATRALGNFAQEAEQRRLERLGGLGGLRQQIIAAAKAAGKIAPEDEVPIQGPLGVPIDEQSIAENRLKILQQQYINQGTQADQAPETEAEETRQFQLNLQNANIQLKNFPDALYRLSLALDQAAIKLGQLFGNPAAGSNPQTVQGQIGTGVSPSLVGQPYDPSIGIPSGYYIAGGSGPPVYAHYAAGGSPQVGVPSVVGEQGPELFIPKESGTVLSNGVSSLFAKYAARDKANIPYFQNNGVPYAGHDPNIPYFNAQQHGFGSGLDSFQSASINSPQLNNNIASVFQRETQSSAKDLKSSIMDLGKKIDDGNKQILTALSVNNVSQAVQQGTFNALAQQIP